MIIFNDHHEYEGKHAFMGASQNSWLGYNDATLIMRWMSQYTQLIGTTIHELVKFCITHRIKLNKSDKHLIDVKLQEAFIPKKAYDSENYIDLVAAYVNDAIGFRMTPEVVLFYSKNCFGTTDTINYDEKTHVLRIHDLKTGLKPASFDQLIIYAALFYLEYKMKPSENQTILRIYQHRYDDEGNILDDLYVEAIAKPEDIEIVMDRIVTGDKVIQDYKGAN